MAAAVTGAAATLSRADVLRTRRHRLGGGDLPWHGPLPAPWSGLPGVAKAVPAIFTREKASIDLAGASIQRVAGVSIPNANVTSSEFKTGAYAYYARLRAEAPVHSVRLPNGHVAWLVSRYDDVIRLLKDERLIKNQRNAEGSKPFSRLPGMLGFLQAIERNMLDGRGGRSADSRIVADRSEQ